MDALDYRGERTHHDRCITFALNETRNTPSISATLLTRAAERLDTLGSSFTGKDLDGVVGDVQRLARRNPAAFIGGAMLIGFAASRFLKSSGHSTDGWDDAPRYEAASPGTSGFGTSGPGGSVEGL